MTRLIDIKQSELNPTLRALSDEGVTIDDFTWIRKGNAALIKQFINEKRGLLDKNPFALTVEEQLNRLRAASEAQSWDIPEDVFARLAETAPEWPVGRDVFQSLRIRFGDGDAGVAKTFEAHAAQIEQVFGKTNYYRWQYFLSGTHPYEGEDVERLRLLAGNESHKPTIEWVMVDLSAHRKRKSIEAVRGERSIADEGLVLAWMFPERVRAMDHDKLPAFFLAGYELNVPVEDEELWQRVPSVDFDRDDGEVELDAYWHSNDDADCSVPVCRE